MTNKIRILIAEDHKTVREGLKLIVNQQADMETVGEAGNGREAIRLAEELKPDIVLLDISMPELNGLTAAAKLNRILPDVKILTLTRHTEEAYLQELLEAGVAGYVLKQSPSSEMIRAIRTVAAGGKYLDSEMTGKFFKSFSDKGAKLRGETSGQKLTGREEDILRHIALGYTNKEVSEIYDISVKTVEAHKANALKKLNLTSRKDIIQYAVFRGWMQSH